MAVAQFSFIFCLLFNEFTPGYIYVGDKLTYNLLMMVISLTYHYCKCSFKQFDCNSIIVNSLAIDDNVKLTYELLLIIRSCLYLTFFLLRDLLTF